jgi:hypothetical protein
MRRNMNFRKGRVSRRSFVGGVAAGVAGAAVGLGGVARAYQQFDGNPNILIPEPGDPEHGIYDAVVLPIGNPNPTHPHPVFGFPCTEDVYNVQMAVMIFSNVLLRSTETHFDFGNNSMYFPFNVAICGSKTVQGETNSFGKTEILNGSGLFLINHYICGPQFPTPTVAIKDLVSEDATFAFCGAYTIGDVTIENVDVLDIGLLPGDSFILGFYSHHKGKWTIKDCKVQSSAQAPFNIGIGYFGLWYRNFLGTEITLKGNNINNQGIGIMISNNNELDNDYLITIGMDDEQNPDDRNTINSPIGIFLEDEFTGFGEARIDSNIINSSDMGIYTMGLHDSLIQYNEISGCETGIMLDFPVTRDGMDNNVITDNTVQANDPYVIQDSFWFANPSTDNSPNPSLNMSIDKTLFPHTKNNQIRAAGSSLTLINLPKNVFMMHNETDIVDIASITGPDNPHSISAVGVQFEKMYKNWCKKMDGKWDKDEGCTF